MTVAKPIQVPLTLTRAIEIASELASLINVYESFQDEANDADSKAASNYWSRRRDEVTQLHNDLHRAIKSVTDSLTTNTALFGSVQAQGSSV